MAIKHWKFKCFAYHQVASAQIPEYHTKSENQTIHHLLHCIVWCAADTCVDGICGPAARSALLLPQRRKRKCTHTTQLLHTPNQFDTIHLFWPHGGILFRFPQHSWAGCQRVHHAEEFRGWGDVLQSGRSLLQTTHCRCWKDVSTNHQKINNKRTKTTTKNLNRFKLISLNFSARSTAYLYLIMTINWIFEIISFYTQTPSSSSLVLFDVLNALQGVVIFIIFLCLPRPKRIITRWWKSEGTFECNHTEMEVLNNHSQIKK